MSDGFNPHSHSSGTPTGMFDSLENFQRAWQGLQGGSPFQNGLFQNLPFQPTMDPRALEQRISELRTVEQWLTLNLNLLRSTIQTLEMQKASLQAFQDLSAAFSRASGTAPAAGPSPETTSAPAGTPAAGPTASTNPHAAEHDTPQTTAGFAPAAGTTPPADSGQSPPGFPFPMPGGFPPNPFGANPFIAQPLAGIGPVPPPAGQGGQPPDTPRHTSLNPATEAAAPTTTTATPPDTVSQLSQGWWQMMQNQVGQLADLAAQHWPSTPGTRAGGATPPSPAAATPGTTQAPAPARSPRARSASPAKRTEARDNQKTGTRRPRAHTRTRKPD